MFMSEVVAVFSIIVIYLVTGKYVARGAIDILPAYFTFYAAYRSSSINLSPKVTKSLWDALLIQCEDYAKALSAIECL